MGMGRKQIAISTNSETPLPATTNPKATERQEDLQPILTAD
jgi:hypothetical protein